MPNGTFVHQDPWAQGEKYKKSSGNDGDDSDMTFVRCFHDLKTGKIEKCSFCVERCFAFTEKGMGLAFSSAPYLLKIGETVPPEEGLSSAHVVFNDLPIFLFCQF